MHFGEIIENALKGVDLDSGYYGIGEKEKWLQRLSIAKIVSVVSLIFLTVATVLAFTSGIFVGTLALLATVAARDIYVVIDNSEKIIENRLKNFLHSTMLTTKQQTSVVTADTWIIKPICMLAMR